MLKTINSSYYPKFFKLFLIGSFFLLVATIILYNKEVNNLVNNLKKEEQNKLLLQVNEIKYDFKSLKGDILFLNDLVSRSPYALCSNKKPIAPLKREISQYLKRKKIYDQVRILNTQGDEVLKCIYNKNKTTYFPDSLLQNKSHRYYFKEISKLKNEDIYFSKFDLNIENGIVETPNKPVLRVGSKLYGCNNTYSGVLILNYLGKNLIKRIEQINNRFTGDFYLLDNNGYYLMSPDEHQNWGFMFPETKDNTFVNEFPVSWNKVKGLTSGQIETDKGLFTFYTLNFKQIVNNGESDLIQYYASSDFWKVVSFVPQQKITVLKKNILHHFYLPVTLLLLLCLSISWLIVYNRYKEKKSTNEIFKLASIVKSSTNIVFITDLNGHIEWANHSMEKLINSPLSAIKNQHFKQLIIGDRTPVKVISQINNAIKELQSTSVQVVNTYKNDSEIWHNLHIKPLVYTTEKEINKIIFIGTDITEILKAKKEIVELNNTLEERVTFRTLELNQALERETKLNTIKSSFISMASHELRTPLGIIMSSTDLVGTYCNSSDSAKVKKHLERIKSSVRNLIHTLNYFLDSNNLENQADSPVHTSLELNQELLKVISQFEDLVKKDQKITLLKTTPTHLVLDKNMFYNIMQNLISNAIKYSEKDIIITLENKHQEVSIQVADQGIGIPEDQQKNIFSKFFRANNVDEIEGNGLGLNIVKHYVSKMNGTINFKSIPNKGTTFILKLKKVIT